MCKFELTYTGLNDALRNIAGWIILTFHERTIDISSDSEQYQKSHRGIWWSYTGT